jgi:PPK2 family polyphosphate:nucleotide phosphotransferase
MSRFSHAQIAEFTELFRVQPGSRVDITKDFDPRFKADFVDKESADELLAQGVELLSEYQARLAAQDAWAVLVCIQALDAAGKDSLIKHVMSGVNPQGVQVTSFKAPTPEEYDHDYLWRHQKRLPERGGIGIFNRSHYEEVLVVRVHPEYLGGGKLPPDAVGDDVWKRRYRQINEWERHLAENGYAVCKIMLNVSKEEQRCRFLERIDDPTKNWKFSAGDLDERALWDAYMDAFSEMLSHTSTEWAPWYVVPADRKWFTRLAAAAIIAETLIRIDPRFPEPDEAARAEMEQCRARLVAEAAGDPRCE